MSLYASIEAFVKVILGLLIFLQVFNLLEPRFGFIVLLCIATYLLIRGSYELYTIFSSAN
jgi:hypothetical protein